MTAKAHALTTTKDKLDIIKFLNFCTSKDIKKMGKK